MSRGKRLAVGDRVQIDHPLTLIVGDGSYSDGFADIDVSEPETDNDEMMMVDEFEEVTTPPSEEDVELTE